MASLRLRTVRVLGVAAVMGVTASACGGSPAAAPAQTTTTVGSTTVATIPPASTTTTTATTPTTPTFTVPTTAPPVVPPAPQPTAEDAADALVGYWASGNRATAMRVATPQAVATLFAVAYPNGLAINRGCSDAFSPIICTYGAPGGGPVNAPIYQLLEVQAPGGWYVSSVEIQ